MDSKDQRDVRALAKEEMLYSILVDVSLNRPQVIDTKKVLWMMGRTYDKPDAWVRLVDMWVEITGLSRDSLYGTYWGGTILLSNKPLASVASEWGGEDDKPQALSKAA